MASDVKAGGAYVELMTRDKTFSSGLKKARLSLVNFAAGAYLVKTAFSALKSVYGATVGLATTQIQNEAKLAAVLKATGNAAGFTADQLKKQASELQSITTFGDESIISMQAVLATFKDIKGDNFKAAEAAILDMSQVLGQDLQSSAIQVGKALNNPTKGISALSRVGVSFTEQQKEQVKAMQAAGDMAGAQAIILQELQSEFGGAAEAAAKAGGGPLKQFHNVMGDLFEAIGGLILPAIDTFAGRLTGVLGTAITWLQGHTSAMLSAAGEAWNGFLGFVSPIMIGLGSIVYDVFSSIAAIVGSAWGAVAESTSGVMDWMQGTIISVLSAISFAWNNWQLLLKVALVSAELSVVTFANQVVYFFTEMIPGYLSWFGDNWRDVFTDIGNLTATVASNIWANLKSLWDGIVGLFSGEGFSFEWTPLTQGFESAIKELPKIAEREMGPLEKSLSDEMNALGAEVNKSWEDHSKEFAATIDNYAPKIAELAGADISVGGGAEGAAAAIAAATPAAGTSKQKTFGSFSAAALAAAGGGSGDPGADKIVKTIEKAEAEKAKRDERIIKRLEEQGIA